MKKKIAPTTAVNKYVQQVIAFGKKNPVYAAGIALIAVFAFSSFISYLRAQEILPEAQQAQTVKAPQVLIINKGDSMMWIGMEVAQLSNVIRTEFKIPGNIKGMFVIDEGKSLAMTYGIKTGDVITSVSRRRVATPKEFINAANAAHFREGILLDVYRDGKNFYVTIPFAYQYGPLMGANKGSWQLGAPLVGQALPYGPLVH
ncbi:MAG: hypothetical protein HQL17_02855 [Candidatus Omnitrophica bacterium]|nr:hypothetical protein [Candidatus Omnitrophota bacterium]